MSLQDDFSLNLIEIKMTFVTQCESLCLYRLNRTVLVVNVKNLVLEIMSLNMV